MAQISIHVEAIESFPMSETLVHVSYEHRLESGQIIDKGDLLLHGTPDQLIHLGNEIIRRAKAYQYQLDGGD